MDRLLGRSSNSMLEPVQTHLNIMQWHIAATWGTSPLPCLLEPSRIIAILYLDGWSKQQTWPDSWPVSKTIAALKWFSEAGLSRPASRQPASTLMHLCLLILRIRPDGSAAIHQVGAEIP